MGSIAEQKFTGLGQVSKPFSLLDAGKIQCLIVPDLYEVGYESMNEIASKLKNSWYQMESHETEIQVVYKKDLFSEDIERFCILMSRKREEKQ